jgi:hypothetical protein
MVNNRPSLVVIKGELALLRRGGLLRPASSNGRAGSNPRGRQRPRSGNPPSRRSRRFEARRWVVAVAVNAGRRHCVSW